MIVFTGGFPYVGKSEFVRTLVQCLDAEVIAIEPKEYYPKGFDKLPPEKRTAIATSAWEVCMEQVEKSIKDTSPSDIIIFDTAAKRLNAMRPLFTIAKVHHHKIFYVFVAAAIDECSGRAKDRWDEKFEDDYANSFDVTVPALKRLADVFRLVVNHDDPDRTALNEAAAEVAAQILDIRSGMEV